MKPVKEFFRVSDVDSFLRLAESTSVVIRLDPLIMVNYYGLVFYLDMGKLDKRDVRRVLMALRDKIISVEEIKRAGSLQEFVGNVLNQKPQK